MSKEIRRNLVIIIILAVVIGGYAFFFLSPRIFQESKENLLNTEIEQQSLRKDRIRGGEQERRA